MTPSPITSCFKSWVAPGIRDQRLCEAMRRGQSFFQMSCCSVEEGEGHTGPRDTKESGRMRAWMLMENQKRGMGAERERVLGELPISQS